jgi:hypothetical protein
MLQDLVQHKWYTNARLLRAIRQKQEATQDRQLRDLLHHTLLANRFRLRLSQAVPCSFEPDSQAPEALAAIIAQYRETHAEEASGLAPLEEADLDKTLATPYISGGGFSMAKALIEVCLRSRGHRAQGAMRPAPAGANSAWAGFHG